MSDTDEGPSNLTRAQMDVMKRNRFIEMIDEDCRDRILAGATQDACNARKADLRARLDATADADLGGFTIDGAS